MKKTLILLIFLLVLAGIYYFLEGNKNSGSINLENRDFVVENLEDISYLTIKHKTYPEMHLQKVSEDHWLLNGKYKADLNIVKNMIGVLSHMEIKNIPTKATNTNVIKNLDKIGIEINSYDKNGKILKELVMGGNDNRETSTYCIRKGYKQSYAMHVKVSDGGLRNYFDQTQHNLRDKSVFDINPVEIESLSISYLKDKKNSFKISKKNSEFEIEAIDQFNSKMKIGNFNVTDAYLKDYGRIYCEAIRTGDITMDSIRQFVPFAKLEFDLKGNESKSFEFYPMLDLLDNEVNTQRIRDLSEIERYFVFSNDNEAYVVQHKQVRDFFKPITYFY